MGLSIEQLTERTASRSDWKELCVTPPPSQVPAEARACRNCGFILDTVLLKEQHESSSVGCGARALLSLVEPGISEQHPLDRYRHLLTRQRALRKRLRNTARHRGARKAKRARRMPPPPPPSLYTQTGPDNRFERDNGHPGRYTGVDRNSHRTRTRRIG